MTNRSEAGKLLLAKSNSSTRNVVDEPHDISAASMFGVKADGTTDDTAAFGQALAYAGFMYSSGVGTPTVRLPSGTTRIRQPQTISRGIRLRGAGEAATRLLWDPLLAYYASDFLSIGIPNAAAYLAGDLTYRQWDHAGVSDMTITTVDEGKASNLWVVQGNGVVFNTVLYGTCNDVVVKGFAKPGANGVVVDGASQHWHSRNLMCTGCDTGFWLKEALASNAFDLKVDACVSYGARITNAKQFNWCGGLVQGSMPIGIDMTPAATPYNAAPQNANVALSGCLHFELSGGATAIRARLGDGTGSNVSFSCRDSTFSVAGGKHFDLANAVYVSLDNNQQGLGASDVGLKLRDCSGVTVRGSICLVKSGTQVDVPTGNQSNANQIVWTGNGTIGINTSYCPLDGAGIVVGSGSVATNAQAVRANGGVGITAAYSDGNEPATCAIGDLIYTSWGSIKKCIKAADGTDPRGLWIDELNPFKSGFTASTTQTQGAATKLVYTISGTDHPLARAVVSTVANNNDAAKLYPATANVEQLVINAGANTLQLFPSSGCDLGAGTNASTTIAAGSFKRFLGLNSTTHKDIT